MQNKLHQLFSNDKIRFVYSPLAYTNNGVMAIMDVKENNIHRLKNLHSTISDGINRVDMFEERISTLFLGVINPEDKAHYANLSSFQDRIITINIPYTLDYETVVKIYKNKYGNKIGEHFLPGVLDNFARIIVSTRLEETKAIKNWIKNPKNYKFADDKLFLVKMEIYTGTIPNWLTDEDKNNFTKEIRKELLDDSALEGLKGISGRKALNIFNTFFTKYTARQGMRITMDEVIDFFTKENPDLKELIPPNFLEALTRLYDYSVLQQVKESIYFFNTEQIGRDIKNYLFAINFDNQQSLVCPYTNDKILINEDFFKNFEAIFLGTLSKPDERKKFRENTLKEYISKTLSQEMNVDAKEIGDTLQYKYLFARYTANLKEHALAPYLNNANFRRAILDYGEKKFQNYDERLKTDVCRLINNLKKIQNYSKKGAQQICIYVIDKDLAKKY
jgi:predicted Ser/Thr protein kinase